VTVTGSVTRVERGTDRRDEHWFDELADFLGPAYLRNAFTV
jgi:hypothetical protein